MKKLILLMCGLALLGMFSCKPKEDPINKKIMGLESMAELGTVEYTVTKIIKANDPKWYKHGERKILFSSVAYIKAGIDMQEFSMNNVTYDKEAKSVSVVLPRAKVLSFNMPPEKIDLVFCETSGARKDFTIEETNDLKIQAENSIREDIPNMGILQDAENNAKGFFKVLLTQLGFEIITIKFE